MQSDYKYDKQFSANEYKLETTRSQKTEKKAGKIWENNLN